MVGTIFGGIEEEVPGAGGVEEEIGEDLGRVLAKVAEEVTEVAIMPGDSRRMTRSAAARTRKLSLMIDFEGKPTEMLS
jgi:hypothetical protein